MKPRRIFLWFTLFAAASLASPARAKTISLDGDWSFAPDPRGTMFLSDLASAQKIPVTVPGSWQAELIDERDYAGVAWYWRSINLDAVPAGQVALLRFGAVDYKADVYVNGKKVGSHEGGYLPFEFDVTSLLRTGENQIAVRVADPGAKPHDVVEGINYAEIPHGKQNWYVQTSGLWQSVELDVRTHVHFDTVHVSAGADGKFRIQAALANAPAAGGRIDFEMRDPTRHIVWQQTVTASQGTAEASGQLSNPSLWGLSNPALYTLEAHLDSGDTESVRFGFRTFETRQGKFYLNGQPVLLRGALDQAFYPDTVYTPPSLNYIRDEMRRAKALGLNLLRCHIKVPDPRYLEAADENGVLIWYEIPNWDKLTSNAQRRAQETLEGMVRRDWNHPSIVIVSIINESWGADLREASDRAWLKQAYEYAKRLVPGWLVVDNSACCNNFHLETDIADFHQYNSVPDHAEDFDRFIGDFVTRPQWLFSQFEDAAPRGDEPLVLSEFGNWGLTHLHQPEPWWFGRDFGGREITLPGGVEKRFADYGYGSLFKNYDELADATQHRQFESLKYEIDALRLHPEIQGYVITEFTDLNWESNGLLDMWRQPKVFASDLAKRQQNDLLILRPHRHNYQPGDNVKVEVYVSHYSTQSLAGATVEWTLEGTSQYITMVPPAIGDDTVTHVGVLQFQAPEESAPAAPQLRVRLVSGGHVISEESVTLYIYPPEKPLLPPPVSFHDPGGRLRRLVNEMRERGYLSPTGSETFPVLISSAWDNAAKQVLAQGGIVILLPTDAMTLAPGLEVVPRSKDDLDGNWISNFSWIRKGQGPFKALGFDTLTGFETEAVTPNVVLRGVPAEHFDDVLAGMFYGWIHANVATLAQARLGRGKLFVCTYSLGTSYGSDPYATRLLDTLISYAVSGVTPRYEITAGTP